MKALNKVINQTLDSSLQNKSTITFESLKNPSTNVIQKGVNALELIGNKLLDNETFIKGTAILMANYGTEYSKEKFKVTFDILKKDKWTEERFLRTLEYIIKNNPYPNWNIANWYQFDIRVFPALNCSAPDGADFYYIGDDFNEIIWNEKKIFGKGVLVWKEPDGNEIPFLKFKKINGKLVKVT